MIDEAWTRRQLEHRETDELVDILATRDEEEWQPAVFGIVEAMLRERGVDVEQAVAERRSAPGAAPVLRLGDPEPESARPQVVAELDDEVEAGLCRMALLDAGIDARIADPDGSGRLQLLVDGARAEEARALLEKDETASDAAEPPGCASCGFIVEPVREGDRLLCPVCGEES